MAICAVFACGVAIAAPAQNPRGGGAATTTTTSATSRADSGRVVRVNSAAAENAGKTTTARNAATVSRTATARPSVTVARTATAQPQKSANVVTGRSGTIRQTAPTSANAASARSATVSRAAASNVVRAAHTPASTARAGTTKTVVGGSRASNARATAVFSDISAIGGGYAQCREAYATCMDQFCANANDTYRRCICSNRYNEFRDTENAIDQALNLLAQFQDNNLTAVNLSAEEVTAMYTATEGEEAIKRDTSAAANMLSEINDLLSGKSSSSSSSSSGSSTSLGILTIDFTSDIGDIWGDGGGSSIFDSSTGVDLSTLTGQELYSAASRQCTEIIADSCENDAVLNMARSAYSIMITQDCNLYERNINTQKEGLEQTVRTAEKYLREARLEEYQSHNSADVNECISAVRAAIQTDSACGPNYERCLDYTGAYINQTTGEAIYSPRLFELEDMILLPGVSGGYNGSEDILTASTNNQNFNNFLDDKRMFAESALDTCRDIADTVWTEFKRQALIEIAQAQDEKIEEVKMSCVSTMAECYDTQSGQLRDMDTTTSQYSGAVSAYAARSMCEEKVIACAALYGGNETCEFDGNGHLVTSDGASGTAANERCGLTALLDFVDTVDTARIVEGCEVALENYLIDMCTPTTGDMGYPWNCRNLTIDDVTGRLNDFAVQNCGMAESETGDEGTFASGDVRQQITDVTAELFEDLGEQLAVTCENLDGYWLYNDNYLDAIYGENRNITSTTSSRANEETALLAGFYNSVYGGNEIVDWGRCVENTVRIRCLEYNNGLETPVASYDLGRDECTFTDEWYRQQCEEKLGGYYEGSICYTPDE